MSRTSRLRRSLPCVAALTALVVLLPTQTAGARTADTTPPSAPTSLRITATGQTGLTLAWSPSTDNVGVAVYRGYVNGTYNGETTLTSYAFAGFACGTSYTLGIEAVDAAGNRSTRATLTASTSPCAGDTTPPSAPTSLRISATGQTGLTLAWSPSTDNVGVAVYRGYVNGTYNGETTLTSYAFAGFACGTSYTLGIEAVDAAGNRSTRATLTASTSPCAGDTTPPSAPTSLRISATGQTGLTLAWSPSTDNVGVSVYRGYVNGTYNGETTLTSYAFAGFACGTSYTLGIEAVDAAGNRSTRATLTASTSACSPTSSCVSGECMPVGNLPGWTQVFTDDFSTNAPLGSFSGCTTNGYTCSGLPQAVRDKWFAYPDGWSDGKSGTYAPSRVLSIANGVMNIYLHSENGAHLVSAPMPKIPGTSSQLGMTYGRYAARLKADPLHGYETAWLLWPDSNVWPRDGEIDLPEGYLDGNLCMFLHHQGGTSSSDQDGWCSTVTYTSWHTIVLEWMPTYANFYIDGKLIMSSTSRIPNTPMHWVLQTDTAPCCVPDNTTAGNLQIDWVAVWKPA